MAAFGIRAIHPTASRAHVFGHASTPSGDNFEIWAGPDETDLIWRTHTDGDIIPGPSAATALSLSATDGFVYIRSGNGVPVGTPTHAGNGRVPLYFDYANNNLYVYDGSWLSVALT